MSSFADLAQVHTFSKVFTPAELDRIVQLGDKEQWHEGRADYAPKEIRHCSVAWLQDDSLSLKLSEVVDSINKEFFHFDLDPWFREPFQYTHYGVGEHFGWHVDMGPKTVAPRKLSMSVQLSNPEDYDGGELLMQCGSWTSTAPVERGAVIVFPSWTMHKVQPITRGHRRSLVVWAHGPQFR